MSEAQAALAAAAPNPGTPAPAPVKLTAIQRIEQELGGFIRQREQAVANVHAVEGAIQAAQHLLNVLRGEEAKAEAEAKALLEKAKTEGEKVLTAVEGEVSKGIALVEKI